MFKKYKKSTLFVITIITCLVLLNGVSIFKNWQFSQKFSKYSFGGTITEKKDIGIVVKNARKESRFVPITTDVLFYRGKNTINYSEIATDSFVIVEFDPADLKTLKVHVLNHDK